METHKLKLEPRHLEALREIVAHLLVLNFPGTQAALDAELSTCD